MMIGQPAEEIGAGAAMMLKAGLYEKFPIPDYGIALTFFTNNSSRKSWLW